MAVHLVKQHLENVSADLLEEYQALIGDHLRQKHGVYALYDGNTLYYVGLASNMRIRLKQHLKDRHKGLWDRFSIYITKSDRHMRELEALLLRIVKPSGNRQIGKLTGSTNLKPELSRELRAHQRALLKTLVGATSRRVKKKSRQAKESNRRSEAALGQYVTKPFTIRAEYKGYEYRARVLRSGWIRYNGYHYSTPSALASEIRDGSTNGWQFWKYRDENGDWIPLGKLRD